MKCQPAVFPTGQPQLRPDPQAAITGGEQPADIDAGELRLIVRRLPDDVPVAVESQQAELRAQPQVSVRSLCDRGDGVLE